VVTESDVLKCLSDEKCREILTIIHETGSISLTALNLTRKQYYSRLHSILTCALARKKMGRYQLTSFGKVVFDWHLSLRDVISKEYWRLAAIDTLSHSGMPDSDKIKIANSLIENEQVRRILTPTSSSQRVEQRNEQVNDAVSYPVRIQ
jgi:hypothetical protein